MSENKRLVPQIRFPEFTDDWEQCKLEECLLEITYGFTNPMSDTADGPWKITAKDIVDGSINYSSARHTSQREFDRLTNKSKPFVGDLLLTKDGTLGRTAIVNAENICINQSVALLRFNPKCSALYVKTILDTPMYQKKMLDDAGGGTIKHIYITKIDKMYIPIPSMKEQERLVGFFNGLDNLITLHQRECDTYKKMKRGMMQKLFNQEFRFKKNDGTAYVAWKNKLLGNCCTIKTGKLDANAAVEGGEYKFFTCAREDSRIDKYAFEGIAIVIAGNGDIGHTKLYDGKFNAYQRTYVLQNFTDNARYLQAVIDTYLPAQICTDTQGSTMPYIKLATLKDLQIPIPVDTEEQTKIANCLAEFDNLIDASERRLEAYKLLKKAMLQKMFV